MDIQKIKNRLDEIFKTYRIVFWNDPEGECEDELNGCLPEGVNILRPDKMGQLKIKVLIEIEKPEDKFLVYAPFIEPGYEEDWLLDIRLYSYQFYADTASMILEELGLQRHSLRDHIAKRKKYFANKQRTAELQKIISPVDDEETIDLKILAVLTKSENWRFEDIVQALFADIHSKEESEGAIFQEGLDTIPESFTAIQKMGMEETFWDFAGKIFAYKEERPTLRHFITSLFISDLFAAANELLPDNVSQFILSGKYIRDVAVCMSEWRDSIKLSGAYDRLSEMVAEALDIENGISGICTALPVEKIKDAVTFFAVEKICARKIKEYVLEHTDTMDTAYVTDLCRARQNMHWANKRLGSDEMPRDAFWAVYEALIAASEFVNNKNSLPKGLSCDSQKEFFRKYVTEFYKFDRLYRVFCENAAYADAKGWAILKEVKERLEDTYRNWFLEELSLLWEKKVNLEDWKIEGVINQYAFFDAFPKVSAGDKNAAVFVIISDALRYEAGKEVAEILNGRYRFEANCEAILGCVPSYTALGMSSLLPHEKLGFSDKGEILVDGKTCASIAQRNNFLEAYNGLAIKSEDLIKMGRDEARNLVRGKNIVYVYHNTIDALGDDAKSEEKTFPTVRQAINEVCDMAVRAMDSLNARAVFITADHGFVYTNRPPKVPDRNPISESGENLIKMNKRFIYGKYLPLIDNVHRGKFSDTEGFSPENDMSFAVPKGMSLFYFTGGARFFHGGLSLQEVAIPVIVVKEVRGKEKEKTREKTVGIQVLGQEHRITTEKHRFVILQTDAVSERVKPLTCKIGIYKGSEPVSDIRTITFDSASQEISERKKEILLILKNIEFTSTEKYRLVFRNADTNIEEQSVPVRIDRAFTTDF